MTETTEIIENFQIDVNKIDECFPMESYRPHQREVIQEIVQHINTGTKFIIAECPTGSGKSPIAVTLARLAGSHKAYYITTTKMLQDQIEADFGDVATLKGRNAYPCTAYVNFSKQIGHQLGKTKVDQRIAEAPACDMGFCKVENGKGSCRLCLPSADEIGRGTFYRPDGMEFSACPYFEKFYQACNAQTASMNFNNFILHLNYGGKFQPRKIMVIDEAHNTEEKLLGFLECTINSIHVDTKVPEYRTAREYTDWLTSIGAIDIMKNKIEDAQANRDIKTVNTYEGLIKNYITMIMSVREDPSGWVIEHEHDKKTDVTKAVLKPIYVKKAARTFLFAHADIIVFLSATILNANTFAKNLGIRSGEFAAIRVPSIFPVENRPIVKDFAGKFTGGQTAMPNWIGKMVAKVEEIANRYKNVKGIIHTHSFGIQKELMERLNRETKDRLITQHQFSTKTEMLEKHASTQNSILIAPAMHEGVDLKDDLSRFQILCKVPYANYFENKQLKARMDLDSDYYSYLTILKIVQSVGRSVRSPNDWADTFIIDEAFNRIYEQNQNMFPQWFKEAVTTKIPVPF